MEIGSEFCLEPTPNSAGHALPKWLSKFGNVALTSSGRGAIAMLLTQVQPKTNTVLLPAYICDSVLAPFMEQGYRCYFYDLGEGLSPDVEDINRHKDIGIFFHMGYYGFASNSNLSDVIDNLAAESTIIVEDVTHTLFSSYPRFEKNDYYIASVRKWFGVPCGGMLAAPNRTIDSSSLMNESTFPAIRLKALWLKSQYLKGGEQDLKSSYLSLFEQAERMLESDMGSYKIDILSENILKTVDHDLIVNKRKSNFMLLADGLASMSGARGVFSDVPADVCPMFFPILIDRNRNQIRQKLSQEKIYCPIHWPGPKHSLNHFEKASEIYNTILSIPCDQRYGPQEMEYVVSVLRQLISM